MLYPWIPFLLVACVVMVILTLAMIAAMLNRSLDIFEIISLSGFSYDPNQDMFYSELNAWQRKMGYCHLYDEFLAPLGMIIDCEPIHFDYGGKNWMIQFWKGQYALNTGCEIGVYSVEEPDPDNPDFFPGTFYRCAGDEDLLDMAYSLEKQGETLFTGRATHWWLTGFRPGEFSEPSELTMKVELTLKNSKMCQAFIHGLREAGYSEKEILRVGDTVFLNFSEAHTPQPITRTAKTDGLIQKNNQR
ncbi:MAG TPA: DUF4474 domain-containing protein [Bacillota bacterium]|nr:DUF4474 domain-containing protein [Bacillota bacterium]